MPAHNVKCYFCNKTFDANKTPFVQINSRRYAHKTCADKAGEEKLKKEKDKESLYQYLAKLFGKGYDFVANQKLIEKYAEEYKYTYSGMEKALRYFYEIKGNPIEKAEGRVGIIPYCYNDAFNYYYAIWESQQKNEVKPIEKYRPETITIVIEEPQRKVKKKKRFSFLDEEDNGK